MGGLFTHSNRNLKKTHGYELPLLALRGEISLSPQHRLNFLGILKRKIYPFPFHPLPNLVFLKS